MGVCASGKSTLKKHLDALGIASHAIAQEHSQVPQLFRRQGRWVVLLVANWQTVHRRRQLSWDREFYRTEWDRLRAARQDAHLIIHTDALTPHQVAREVCRWYDAWFGLEGLWRQQNVVDETRRTIIRRSLQGSPMV